MTNEQAITEIKNYDKHPNLLSRECRDYILKVLEPQPSKDCVSRNEAIARALGLCLGGHYNNIMVVDMIKDLPPVTPTQSWIPVSERLPESYEHVLCYYEYYHWSKEKVLPEYGLGYYSKEMGIWGGEVANGLDAKVLAWQPLPQPYEEKRGNENG